MSILADKNIVLGITGSIAAYKSAILARLLVRSGASVQIIMTPNAKEFISPLTLSTLTGHTVISDFFDERTKDWNSHVNLGLWADIFLVAPVTASTLSKMAYGQADNMLLTSYLSTRGRCVVAPAMDLDMYAHPATQESLRLLKERGVNVVEPTEGELASHLIGKGRMAEPEDILHYLEEMFSSKGPLSGRKVLLTSGPTYEKIDPVRFIGNYSTGKMGREIAQAMAKQGAEVQMITGPVQTLPDHPRINVISVESAGEMLSACEKLVEWYDIAVFCAAVADYRPAEIVQEKIKREGLESMVLPLVQNPDVSATLGKTKGTRIHVGFALETNTTPEDIMSKMKRKNLDLIVHNSLLDSGAGFGTETNQVTFYTSEGVAHPYPLKSKREVACDLIKELLPLLPDGFNPQYFL